MCTYALVGFPRRFYKVLYHKALMYKDNRSSLGLEEKYGITVCFIFKKIKEIVFESVSMIVRYGIFLSCPTDNLRRGPTKNSVGSKSSIHPGEYK